MCQVNLRVPFNFHTLVIPRGGLFIHSQIHAKHFNKILAKYVLNAFYVPGTLLDTGNRAASKRHVTATRTV